MPEITLVILAFKSSNELGLAAYTVVFTCPHKIWRTWRPMKSGPRFWKKLKYFFTYLKIVANFVVKNYSIIHLKLGTLNFITFFTDYFYRKYKYSYEFSKAHTDFMDALYMNSLNQGSPNVFL